MAEDAKFEDGGERPLHLKAFEADDIPIISAMLQDAVLNATEINWNRKTRQLMLLVHRFRWEVSERLGPERVQSVLAIEDVKSVASQGIDRGDKDLVLSVLALGAEQQSDEDWRIELTLAGDGAIAVTAEALEITLRDVTRPYVAPSGKRPSHS